MLDTEREEDDNYCRSTNNEERAVGAPGTTMRRFTGPRQRGRPVCEDGESEKRGVFSHSLAVCRGCEPAFKRRPGTHLLGQKEVPAWFRRSFASK